MLSLQRFLFICLNSARALSLIALVLVFASTILTMDTDIQAIKKGPVPLTSNASSTATINGTEYYVDCDYLGNSTVPLQPGGSMFAIINHLSIIFQVILLFLSEISWPSSLFDDFIPVFGVTHGVGILGFMQIFIGAAFLSHHVSRFALVSAFFLFAIGCVNVLLGLRYSASIKTKRSFASWHDRVPALPHSTSNLQFGSGYGFGRQAEKNAGLNGFLSEKPVESIPRRMTTGMPIPSRSNLHV